MHYDILYYIILFYIIFTVLCYFIYNYELWYSDLPFRKSLVVCCFCVTSTDVLQHIHIIYTVLCFRFGPRFPPASEIYSADIREIARQAVRELGLERYLKEGVYAMNVGPSFESIAECKMLMTLGADAIGRNCHSKHLRAESCSLEFPLYCGLPNLSKIKCCKSIVPQCSFYAVRWKIRSHQIFIAWKLS